MQLRDRIERRFQAAGFGDETGQLLGLLLRDIRAGLEQQLANLVDRQILNVDFHIVEHAATHTGLGFEPDAYSRLIASAPAALPLDFDRELPPAETRQAARVLGILRGRVNESVAAADAFLRRFQAGRQTDAAGSVAPSPIDRERVPRMHSAQLTQNVRQLVAQSFACLGIVEPTDMRETILIRDGSYCGRRFEADAASAVWFVEENQVKVYRADGTIARIIAPDEVLVHARAAA